MKKFIFLLAFLPFFCQAQETDFAIQKEAQLAGNVTQFAKYFPQEKVYLHFDNTGYFMGETIWFKAYLVRPGTASKAAASHVLYVELVSPEGDVLQTHKICLSKGRGDGCIKLEDLLESGFYEVRAYTRYMTNWGAAGIFSRVFPVFKTPLNEGDYSKKVIDRTNFNRRLPDYRVELDTSATGRPQRLNVRFYPEGGSRVAGLEDRVAYEVTDRDGALKDVQGVLLDSGGDTLTRVPAVRGGRGVFTCYASWTDPVLALRDGRGKVWKFPLPQARDTGCVMRLHVNGTEGEAPDDDLHLEISCTATLRGKPLGLTLMHDGGVLGFENVLVGSEPVKRRISRRKLPAGVSELTLFGPDGRIWADRLFFVAPDSARGDVADIGVTAQGSELTPCGRMCLEMRTKPGSTFSLSVTDADTRTNWHEGNAATWLLLTSDLKGYIADPEYYLGADDAAHREAADLLTMVQGWRRYDWRQMAGLRTFVKKEPLEDHLYVDGRMRRKGRNAETSGVGLSATLYNGSGQWFGVKTETKKDGWYVLQLPDCSGEWTMLMNTGQYGKNVGSIIGIDRHFSPEKGVYGYYETHFTLSETKSLRGQSAEVEGTAGQAGRGNVLMPSLVVKGHRWMVEHPRESWDSERTGAFKASLHYDCDAEADAIADRGEPMPSFTEWLKGRNKFVQGESALTVWLDTISDTIMSPTSLLHYQKMPFDWELPPTAYFKVERMMTDKIWIYRDGMSYRNHPVLWILNNMPKRITNYQQDDMTVSLEPTVNTGEPMPAMLDEVKSVYISEDPERAWRFVRSQELVHMSPASIFIYTHHTYFDKVKGLRRTHFQGFDEPAVYEMPDYSVLPPAKDYRRTLYWNPNVTTDKGGRAKVEFYNNSSCRQIVVSAEGITPDGKALVGE